MDDVKVLMAIAVNGVLATIHSWIDNVVSAEQALLLAGQIAVAFVTAVYVAAKAILLWRRVRSRKRSR